MKSVMLICSSQVSVPPKKGGAIEEIVFEIAKHTRRKMKPIVVTRTRFNYNGVKCVKINSKIRKNKAAAILEDILYGFKCLEQINKEKPGIVHLNTTFTSFPITAFLKGDSKPKIVYTSHSPSWTVPDKEIGKINKFFNRIEAFSMKRADVVTAVSDSMRKGIIKKAGIDKRKIITIQNFSRPDEFSPKYGKKWQRSKKITGNIILFVGKLTYTKGIDYLIQSIPSVLEKYSDTTFVFVGSSEHEQKLDNNPWYGMAKKLGVEKNTLFLGTVSREELPNIYASADIFVLPTLREGMPMVILEAMASGLPIVTTKVSGIPEIVNEKCSIYVKRKDSKTLASSIIKILSDPKKMRRMSKEARRASIRLRKEVVLEKYKNLYRSL